MSSAAVAIGALRVKQYFVHIILGCGNSVPELVLFVPFDSGQVRNFSLPYLFGYKTGFPSLE